MGEARQRHKRKLPPCRHSTFSFAERGHTNLSEKRQAAADRYSRRQRIQNRPTGASSGVGIDNPPPRTSPSRRSSGKLRRGTHLLDRAPAHLQFGEQAVLAG